MTKGNTPNKSSARSYGIRLLGSTDRRSSIDAESLYNLIYDEHPEWVVMPIADGTLVVLASDGTALEIA